MGDAEPGRAPVRAIFTGLSDSYRNVVTQFPHYVFLKKGAMAFLRLDVNATLYWCVRVFACICMLSDEILKCAPKLPVASQMPD